MTGGASDARRRGCTIEHTGLIVPVRAIAGSGCVLPALTPAEAVAPADAICRAKRRME